MATRMISQLDDMERDTAPMASMQRPTPVPWSSESTAPPLPFSSFDALPAMTRGLCALAAIWVGLALFVSAFVFYAETNAELLLALVGAWLFAAGTAYVIADAPPMQQGGVA